MDPLTRRCGVLAMLLLSCAQVIPATAQLQTMSIEKIADGVYGAIWSEMIQDPVHANSLIIIGETGVAVVDADYTPSAARATVAEIRKLTNLPVRYVITTHWHDDHIFGNQVYRDAYPGVEFVAQTRVRTSMIARAQEHRDELVASYGKAFTTVTTRLAKGINGKGEPMTAADRARHVAALAMYRSYLADFKSVQIVLPTITFVDSITLHLGNREVQVHSYGMGNTLGDAVIWLPKEKIVAVGDLVVWPVPYIYGGFPASWGRVLQAVRALGPAVVVPGHGPVMREFGYFDQVAGLLKAMSSQASDAVARGLTLDEARKRFDLTSFHEGFVAGKEAREGTWAASILESGIKAAYDEAKGTFDKDA
ncbi:MAG: MBL fold metallo-hydrolase [Gemmatimonadales bacterium]